MNTRQRKQDLVKGALVVGVDTAEIKRLILNLRAAQTQRLLVKAEIKKCLKHTPGAALLLTVPDFRPMTVVGDLQPVALTRMGAAAQAESVKKRKSRKHQRARRLRPQTYRARRIVRADRNRWPRGLALDDPS